MGAGRGVSGVVQARSGGTCSGRAADRVNSQIADAVKEDDRPGVPAGKELVAGAGADGLLLLLLLLGRPCLCRRCRHRPAAAGAQWTQRRSLALLLLLLWEGRAAKRLAGARGLAAGAVRRANVGGPADRGHAARSHGGGWLKALAELWQHRCRADATGLAAFAAADACCARVGGGSGRTADDLFLATWASPALKTSFSGS